MRMRRKPLRGELLETYDGRGVTFIEMANAGQHKDMVKVLVEDAVQVLLITDLVLPIIDTKDYEKIADEKYAGH